MVLFERSVYIHFRWFWRSPTSFYICICRPNIVLVEWINIPIRITGMKCLETIIGTSIPWLINTWLSSILNDHSQKSSAITDILFSKNLPFGPLPSEWVSLTSFYSWTWVWASSTNQCGQGGLACCGPRGRRESDTTEWLNWTDSMNLWCGQISLLLPIDSSNWRL